MSCDRFIDLGINRILIFFFFFCFKGMGNHKLTMELIADKKSRYKTFKRRGMGLKKKISELCTLCDVKACLIVYGSDGDGPSFS